MLFKEGLLNISVISLYKLDRVSLETESKSETQKQPSIVIMANPQAWKLHEKRDSLNSHRAQWESLNKRVVESLNTLAKQKNIAFAIINGNLTDDGKNSSRDSFYRIYNRLSFPYYVGFGTRDFQENFLRENNGYIYTMIKDLTSQMDAKYSLLSNFIKDYREEYPKGN